MSIYSPVTDFAILSVFSRVGLFNFRQVHQLMIEISEPEYSWNFMELLKISTVTYFLKFLLTMLSDWACLILLLGFLVVLAYQHCVKLWPFLLQFVQYVFFLTGQNPIYHNGNMVRAVSLTYWCFFIAGFRTWDLPFVFLTGIGRWIASDFSNLSHTWFLDRFWVTIDRNNSLTVLCQFLKSQSLFVFKLGQYPSSDFGVFFFSASLKSLQSLFTDIANVRKCCLLSLTVFRHFQRFWNKVVLGPNSFDGSLIVSEKSKSVVFLGNMKSTNLLCSVVPGFRYSRRTFSSLIHCSVNIENIFIAPIKGLEYFVVLRYVFKFFRNVRRGE